MTSKRDPEYDQGLVDGFIDGCVISQPIHEGEHTLDRYLMVNSRYRSFISPFVRRTHYGLGYVNGLDAAAVYLGLY